MKIKLICIILFLNSVTVAQNSGISFLGSYKGKTNEKGYDCILKLTAKNHFYYECFYAENKSWYHEGTFKVKGNRIVFSTTYFSDIQIEIVQSKLPGIGNDSIKIEVDENISKYYSYGYPWKFKTNTGILTPKNTLQNNSIYFSNKKLKYLQLYSPELHRISQKIKLSDTCNYFILKAATNEPATWYFPLQPLEKDSVKSKKNKLKADLGQNYIIRNEASVEDNVINFNDIIFRKVD